MDAVIDQLETGEDPRAIVRSLLGEVCAHMGATSASFVNVYRDEATMVLRMGPVLGYGPGRALERFEGDPVELQELGVELPMSFNAWNVYKPTQMSRWMLDSCWNPIGVRESLSIACAEDGRVTGNVNVYCTGDEPRFEDRHIVLANKVREATRSVLAATSGMMETGPERSGALLFDLHGKVLMHGGTTGEGWADGEFMAILSEAARDFAAKGIETQVRLIRGTQLRLTRMRGDGRSVVLLNVDPATLHDLPDVLKLTPAQRVVAAYASRGATVEEIARSLERAPNTVRSHLKEIYATLGIASRAELVTFCNRAWK